MSQKDEWKKSLQNEINQCDDFMAKAKDISDLVPGVEQRKKEAQARLLFVENMPEPILVELGEPLFRFQKHDEEQLRTYLPGLSGVSPETKRYVTVSGSSTSSAYFDAVQTVRQADGTARFVFSPKPEVELEKIEIVHKAFTELAEEKSKRQSLPPILNGINKDLGYKFIVAQQSFEKAKSGIVGIDQAAIQMRDILEQLWGGLVRLARDKDPHKCSGLDLKWTTRGRSVVVACLTDDLLDAQELSRLLDIVTTLHRNISDIDFGKNPLTKDLDKLKDIYSQWLLVVSDIAGFISIDKIFKSLKLG